MRGCESRGGCERRGCWSADRGFVTAEAAMVLPVLVLVVTTLVWGLLIVLAQIQCVDAARVGARAAARQDPQEAVTRVVREAAPQGARVSVIHQGEQVHVRVVAEPPGIGALPFRIEAEAVAMAEETDETGETRETGETVGRAGTPGVRSGNGRGS
ncbi:TadE family type IV pilus minor pilin [Streptomyces sp. NPDC046985]|uniref:TadE family type IV pilus minor pilin n=1 Tax=Streptomyces sp. NPDC046985 TaxID=3155377 RepID=UPI0033E30066